MVTIPFTPQPCFFLGVNVWRKKTPPIQSHLVERNLEYVSLSRALMMNLCFLDTQNSSKVDTRIPVKTGTCIRVMLTGNISALSQEKTQMQQLLCHMQHQPVISHL